MSNHFSINSSQAPAPMQGNPAPLLALSNKNRLKAAASHLLEFSGTALHIASEITIFVAGIGFFITPPLKKVYEKLLGKHLDYTVTGHGALCFDDPLSSNPSNPACSEIENQTLLSSKLPFNLPFPDNIFTASALLLSLGSTGLVLSFGLKKYGASMREVNPEEITSEDALLVAENRRKALALAHILCVTGSRTAAVYATTIISLTLSLKNFPGILKSFSIPSERVLSYQLDKIVNATSLLPISDLPANPLPPNTMYPTNQLISLVMTLSMYFITHIGFSELSDAAKAGSEEVESLDYVIALCMAAVSALLGHAAFKLEQRKECLDNQINFAKFARKLGLFGEERRPAAPIIKEEEEEEEEKEEETPEAKKPTEPSLYSTKTII